MVQPMLFLHWKQVRFVLLPLALAAYALPLLAVQGLGNAPGMTAPGLEAYRIVFGSAIWQTAFPLLATAVGVTLALSSWNWDHQLGHVYALSLPISRRRYAAMKMGAGAALALLPALTLWAGARVAAASVSLPPGLHAYPDQLAIRFLAATLVAYAILFAMAAGTIRTTLWVLAGIGALLVFDVVATEWLFPWLGVFRDRSLAGWLYHLLSTAPGPFQVFTGHWTLIDV
jgi:hypothetical protein